MCGRNGKQCRERLIYCIIQVQQSLGLKNFVGKTQHRGIETSRKTQ